MESGVGDVISRATNTFSTNQRVINLVLDILEGLIQSPEICKYFSICNYSRVLQSFFTFSIQDETCICKALKCTIQLAAVDSDLDSRPPL